MEKQKTPYKFSKINYSANADDRIFPVEQKVGEFYKYGMYNDFPEYLIYLYNNSSIHNTCVNAVVEGIIGEGLVCDEGHTHMLDHANLEETWNDVFKKMALDYKLYGGYALEVIWSRDRSRISEVYHVDYSWLRAAEKTASGKIPGYYISDEWAEKYKYGIGGGIYNKYQSAGTFEELPYLPTFNPKRAFEQPKQIYVYNPYKPGQKYYPLPDYAGALRVIEVDIETDNFHANNLRNGLTPSLAITTFLNADPDQRMEIESMLRNSYAGTNNAGSLIYMDVDSPENAPKIEPIQSNGTDEYYMQLNDMVQQKILTAHRITSPMILGIKTEGQLGGRAETIDAYLLFTNTVLRPLQQTLVQCVEDMLHYQYPTADKFQVGVQQLNLYNDGSVEQDVVTGIEAEVGEDKKLEGEIEQTDDAVELSSNEVMRTLTGRQYQNLMRIVRHYGQDKITLEQAKTMLAAGFGLSKEQIDAFLGVSGEETIAV